jgi:undecaprenyl diphosphate synthase
MKKSEHNLQHLGIIMDGNRRWARSQGLKDIEGHKKGYEKIKQFGEWCIQRNIPIVSAWAFSTENWNRSSTEVNYLMNLLWLALKQDVKFFHKKNIKLRIIGRSDKLPDKILKAMEKAKEKTKNNTGGIFNICLNYGGRAEIIDAVKKVIDKGYKPEQLNENIIKQNLYSPDLPDPDLIVRTSGEIRHSGFLLWESAYSEYLFLDKYWPQIQENDLDFMISEFTKRNRRFGGDYK